MSKEIEELEEDIEDLEEDVEEEEEPVKRKNVAPSKKVKKEQQEIHETYEIIEREPIYGIMNTLTGEYFLGFDKEKDTALLHVLRLILNKLEKISVIQGV